MVLLAASAALAIKTWCDIRPLDEQSLLIAAGQDHPLLLDRNGVPLAVSYQNPLNADADLPLYEVPQVLEGAFVTAEDRRFFEHHGVDWKARMAALWQNLKALHCVRGASTITEQVVRILHPRPRTLWSRWVEGFEAAELERHASKAQILEFYLSQVPYESQRRGIRQAARFYFNREVATLTPKEMLALAVLPRAPSAYDLYRHPDKIAPAIDRLAAAMNLGQDERTHIHAEPFALSKPDLLVHAKHFVDYVRGNAEAEGATRIVTTLDAHLQQAAETNLAERISDLKGKQAHNGAVLVADHTTGEILAWAVAGSQEEAIDAVRTPRQPGSAMKPFLYALALDSGWNPATIIPDEPMAEEINSGLHRFNNYSHTFYGKVTLREALGNSLNIPAIHTIDHVGVERYLATLHRLGFDSLAQPADFYDEGLALGDGEVTLFEMVQAYAALANHGAYLPLSPLLARPSPRLNEQVYSDEASSLIGNILSDPWARRLEFGLDSILNMPVQTAVKTGTSTDYHDAWALGFNSRYVVGVWLGNLDGTPMDGVTGSTGPALVLRSVFASLDRNSQTAPLYLSPRLVKRDICVAAHDKEGRQCFMRTEYFIAGSEPSANPAQQVPDHPALVRPQDGLFLAYDPRVPPEMQAFEFVAKGIRPDQEASWLLNGERIATTNGGHYLWPLKRGDWRLMLQVAGTDGDMHPADSVEFHVK
jgi:penicillin-binding protein 1C